MKTSGFIGLTTKIRRYGLLFQRPRLGTHASGQGSAYSLIEVLAALAIFLFGIVSILNFFPNVLRAQNEANLVTAGSLLAQEKIMEIRRDNFSSPTGLELIETIRMRTIPTEPQRSPRDERLAYCFSGRSVQDPVDDSDDPRDDFDVARVIILKIDESNIPTTSNIQDWQVLAEIRFDRGL
jgi:type II secretory pathway pseudopilin PulG